MNDAQRHQIRQWVEASEDNRNEFMQARKLYDATLLLAPRTSKAVHNKIIRFVRYAAAIAAAIAIGVFGMYIYVSNDTNSAIQQIVVPEGQRVNIMMADGSEVWLNSGSRMTYSTGFSKKERNVTLDGEGYFKVARDEKRPFRIHTLKADVEVLGTEFNVRSYDRDSIFSTSLIQGSVKLTAENSSAILSPEDEAFLTKDGFKISKIRDHDEFMWKDGILAYRQTPFRELVKRFEQFYNVRIRIDNPDVLDYSSMGKFRREDGVEHALDVLASDAGFTYEVDNDNHLIIIK